MKEFYYLEAEFTKRVDLNGNHFSEFEQLFRCVTRAIEKIHLRIVHKYNVVDSYNIRDLSQTGSRTFPPGIFPPGEKM